MSQPNPEDPLQAWMERDLLPFLKTYYRSNVPNLYTDEIGTALKLLLKLVRFSFSL